MITRNDKLRVLEDFHIDRNLPKHKRKQKRSENTGQVSQATFEATDGESMNQFVVSTGGVTFRPNGFEEDDVKEVPPKRYPWPFSWIHAFLMLFQSKPKQLPPAPVPEISIEEFFLSVKNSVQELEVIQERAAGYEKAIVNAQKAGQTALVEKLREGLGAHRGETQLFAIGKTRYLTEDTIVKFVKQAKKGLRLDWISNFTRPVPVELIPDKQRADELHIFDNYAILHYDPEAKSWEETKLEKAKRKDPILFGLIQGSRNLYYMGDWVDDQCDLTLAQIADALGKEVVQELS
jgi:hypothetical protein